ncbi:Transcription factor try [Thalictrum thalictroides]|uniref:Transcription factor try n=1 Tax=Thalictrum thalictroides TaxID=46969 RepID=A0A7J6W726_THATH|nr:Transcription factor try [Thalictrum thalictroides]
MIVLLKFSLAEQHRPEATVERNAWELKQYIEELYWGSGKRVMQLGHSKGGVDAATTLSVYSLELKDKVVGLVLVQSPYGGFPIASDVLNKGQIADKETRKIMELLICKLIKFQFFLGKLIYLERMGFIHIHDEVKEVSSIEWEFISLTEQEEDLLHLMHKLVGDRWVLIAGRIPGRTPEEL